MPVSAEGIGCAYRGGDYWDASGDDPEVWHSEPDREPIEGLQRSEIKRTETYAGEPAREVEQTEDVSGAKDTAALYNESGSESRYDASAGPTSGSRPDYEPDDWTLRRRKRSGQRGQEQSVSYQAEERYWTDYLRIALPIAGLLLLLGVFWYWASSFIGDDTDDDPTTPVAAIVETPITAPTSTPTVGAAVTIAITTSEPAQETAATEPTQAPDEEPAEPTEEPAADPGTDAGEGGTFAEGDLVVVNDDDVNLRSDATTSSEAVTTLILGQQLRILSAEPIDDGEYIWWNVEDEIGELVGWIAGDFIDPSP